MNFPKNNFAYMKNHLSDGILRQMFYKELRVEVTKPISFGPLFSLFLFF